MFVKIFSPTKLPTAPPTPPPMIFEPSIPKLFKIKVTTIEAAAALTYIITIFIVEPS